MFYGQFQTTIDQKGRIAMPRMLRDGITGDEVVISEGLSQTLFGFDRSEWEQKAVQYFEKPVTDEDARRQRLIIFSRMAVIKIDEQGRIVIGHRFTSMMGIITLPAAIMLVGAGDHFELWTKEAWEEYERENLE